MSGDFLETSRPVLAWLLRTTWEASLVALLVLLAQWLLRGKVSARWRYNLWLLVVARLLLPAVPGAQYSPFNLVQVPRTRVLQATPAARVAPEVTPAAPLPATPVPGPAIRPDRNLDLSLVSNPQSPPVESAVVPERVAVAPAPVMASPAPVASSAPDPVSEPVAMWTAPRAPHPVQRQPLRATATVAPRQAEIQAEPPARAPAPVIPWHQQVNWLALAAVVWIAGVAFGAARLAWVSLRLSAAVRHLPPVRDPALAQLLFECAAQLRLRRLRRVLEGPDGFGPALVG